MFPLLAINVTLLISIAHLGNNPTLHQVDDWLFSSFYIVTNHDSIVLIFREMDFEINSFGGGPPPTNPDITYQV